MNVSVKHNLVEGFRQFQLNRGITEPFVPFEDPDHYLNDFRSPEAKEEDFNLFLVWKAHLPEKPLVVTPTYEDLIKLGRGAKVIAFVEQVDDEPRIIDVVDVYIPKYCYSSISGMGKEGEEMFPDDPMLYYKTSEDDITAVDGINSINSSHVVAIFDFGEPIGDYTNHLFGKVDKNISGDKRRNKRQKKIFGFFGAWNEGTKSNSTTRGVYNGNLLKLVREILSRRPTFRISFDIDDDRFINTYVAAGKPGYIGKYLRPYWQDEEGAIKDLPMAKVNLKAFTKWVLRNYQRFLPSEKELVKQRMEECRQSDRLDYEMYCRDMEDERY